ISRLPTDVLFLLYFGHFRKKGIPYLNLILYIIINVLRGWTGIWLVLFFIEIYFHLKTKSLNKIKKRVIIFIIIAFALYPTINKYKYLMRGGTDVKEQTLLESAAQLGVRLQHVTSGILILQERDALKLDLDKGIIMP